MDLEKISPSKDPFGDSTEPHALDGGLPDPVQPQRLADQGTYPYFPVAIHKLIVMSICTFGFYELYWFYKQWKRIQASSGESMRPFWRAVFAPYWAFKLFKHIEDESASEGRSAAFNGTALAVTYLVLNMTWRLPDPWSLISIATVVPLIPVAQALQRINSRHRQFIRESDNRRYGVLNIATIVIGGGIILLGMVGTFLPDDFGSPFETTRVEGPRRYVQEGIAFEHPGEWEVTGDAIDEGVRFVFVETPGTAMVTVHVYPADEALPVRRFAREYARAAQEETPFGSNTPSRFGRVERVGAAEVVTERFTLDAVGAEEAYTRVYTRRTFGEVVCFVIAQAADDEIDEVTEGFDVITTSLAYRQP